MRRAANIAASVTLVVLVGCAMEEDRTQMTTTPTPQPTATVRPKPVVEIPDGPPPAELVIEDLEPGSGPGAKPGQFLVVHYVGVAWSTKEEFDSSFARGEPYPLQLGAGGVITGWDEGLVGMKAGGRRRLTIPPDKAYGSSGKGRIAPDETLVFVIDLLRIVDPPDSGGEGRQ